MKRFRIFLRLAALIVALWGMFSPATAVAGEFTFRPKVSAGVGAETNPGLIQRPDGFLDRAFLLPQTGTVFGLARAGLETGLKGGNALEFSLSGNWQGKYFFSGGDWQPLDAYNATGEMIFLPRSKIRIPIKGGLYSNHYGSGLTASDDENPGLNQAVFRGWFIEARPTSYQYAQAFPIGVVIGYQEKAYDSEEDQLDNQLTLLNAGVQANWMFLPKTALFFESGWRHGTSEKESVFTANSAYVKVGVTGHVTEQLSLVGSFGYSPTWYLEGDPILDLRAVTTEGGLHYERAANGRTVQANLKWSRKPVDLYWSSAVLDERVQGDFTWKKSGDLAGLSASYGSINYLLNDNATAQNLRVSGFTQQCTKGMILCDSLTGTYDRWWLNDGTVRDNWVGYLMLEVNFKQ